MTRTLSLHPKVQSRLRVELLSSVPLDAKDRTFAMIDNLPYLNAVIMESLRLVNTISSYQTRVVPPGGCVISGYFLPASVSAPILLKLAVYYDYKIIATYEMCMHLDNRFVPTIPHKPTTQYLSFSRNFRPFPLASPTRELPHPRQEYVDLLQRPSRLYWTRTIPS